MYAEEPSAALPARRLARHADLYSTGTHDLLHDLFAADRLNAEVPEFQDACDLEVLELFRSVIDAGHEGGGCGDAVKAAISDAGDGSEARWILEERSEL